MCRSRGGGHLRYCSVAGDRLARLRIGPRHQTWDDRVMDTDMLAQIAGLWRGLSGGQTALQSSGVTVVESDRHRLSPSGWIGIVSLYDRVVIATPNEFRTVVDRGLAMSPAIDALTTVRGVAGVFGEPAQCLGPAVLAHGGHVRSAGSGRSQRLASSTCPRALFTRGTSGERSDEDGFGCVSITRCRRRSGQRKRVSTVAGVDCPHERLDRSGCPRCGVRDHRSCGRPRTCLEQWASRPMAGGRGQPRFAEARRFAWTHRDWASVEFQAAIVLKAHSAQVSAPRKR